MNIVGPNGEEYISGGKYKCIWCRSTINGKAIGIPIQKVGNTIYCELPTCSPSCSLSFIYDHTRLQPGMQDPKYSNSYNLLMEFCKSKGVKKINPAPHWKNLTYHGGNLHPSQFESELTKITL